MSHDTPQETLALLKILALGNQDLAAGKTKPEADIIACLRAKRVGGIVRPAPQRHATKKLHQAAPTPGECVDAQSPMASYLPLIENGSPYGRPDFCSRECCRLR